MWSAADGRTLLRAQLNHVASASRVTTLAPSDSNARMTHDYAARQTDESNPRL
jgi:hypothetical protein